MNKKEFTRYINKQLNGMSLECQIQELQKLQKTYLPELIQARMRRLGTWIPPEKKDDYIFCKKCGKYSLKSKVNKEFVREVRTVTTFTDCGYGDDDRIGDVEYSVTYVICPKCGHKQEHSKYRIRVLREWNRK